MLYVGIDIAKHKHDLVVIETERTIFIRHLQIENNREGFTKLQMILINFQKTTGEEIQIAPHSPYSLLLFYLWYNS